MKNKKLSVKTIIILFLIGMIISLILVIFNIKNANIEKQIASKEQLTETSSDNTYVSMENHLIEVNNQEEKLLNFKSAIATAITNEGITTSNTDTQETMATNIANILKEKTKDATVTADNISEGYTAYVNGELITGNGADNNSYRNEGYNAGYAQGYSEGLNSTGTIQYTYHTHSGSSTSGGGCYKAQICGGSFNSAGKCYGCGKYTGTNGESYCDRVIGYTLGCGKTTSTIESATIVFN